jgi:N-acetylglutamate synthase
MPAPWSISNLTADDYDAVRDLWDVAGLPVRPAGRDGREQFAAQLSRETQTVIGAWEAGRLVGVSVVTHDGRKGWINRLAVHPNCRRQGLGLELIAESERILREKGMQVIAALIEDWNDVSLALFEHAGYRDYPDIHYLTKREGQDV